MDFEINVEEGVDEYLAESIGCRLAWHITYLEVPLGGNSNNISLGDRVVNKSSKRLECGKGACSP